MRLIRLLFMLILTMGIATASSTALLQDNVSVPVPDGVSTTQVEAAIAIGIEERRWAATDRKPGEIVAELATRDHIAKVKVVYDLKNVTIDYVSSVNLDYSEQDGQRVIHHNYNKWVLLLARDIENAMQHAALTQNNPEQTPKN